MGLREVRFRQENAELIPSRPRQDVFRFQALREQFRGGLDDFVSFLMPHGIVQELQAVDVTDDERQGLVFGSVVFFDLHVKIDAVVNAGETVMEA